MSLRLKILLSLGVSFLILFSLIIGFSKFFGSQVFSDLEKEFVLNSIQKVITKFDDIQSHLSAVAGDWAYWDDTYNFMKKHDSKYIDKNLKSDDLIKSEVDFIIFINNNGEVVFSKLIRNPSDGQKTITINEIGKKFKPFNPPELRLPWTSKKGFLQTENYPALIAIRPILKSDGSGPIEGAIIVGSFLDSFELKRIAEHFEYEILFKKVQKNAQLQGFDSATDVYHGEGQIIIHLASKELIEGAVFLQDIHGDPSFILTIRMLRPFYNISKGAILYYSIAILFIGLFFLAVVIFLIEKQVLSPIIKLCRQLEDILTLDDLNHRISIKGTTEFKKLSNSANIMLENLSNQAKELKDLNEMLKSEISERKRTEKALEKSKHNLESIVEIRTSELKSMNDQLQKEIDYRKIREKERHNLQNQLQRAQKMEAIGTLAGGIAHDFNNLLMAIQGNISIMLLNRDPSDPEYETLKLIEKRIIGGAEMTSQLLGYAQKGKYENKPIDINQLIRENISAYKQMRKDFNIKLDLCETLCTVKGDRGQLESVLLNLFANASDAMPTGGSLYISTDIVEDNEIMSSKFKPKTGRYVKLIMRDTGIGIDAEDIDRIFEPFFTTKEIGHGTGLGLSSVYGIVKHHNGYIDVTSKKNKGTNFYIYLPLSSEKVQRNDFVKHQILSTGGQIMVVDDEELVLSVASVLLEKLGYSVFKAQNGEEALNIFKSNKNNIDLVILDMIMPDMNGEQIFEKLKEIDPDVNVLIATGFSLEGRPSILLEKGCKGILQKPFTHEVLSNKIKEII